MLPLAEGVTCAMDGGAAFAGGCKLRDRRSDGTVCLAHGDGLLGLN